MELRKATEIRHSQNRPRIRFSHLKGPGNFHLGFFVYRSLSADQPQRSSLLLFCYYIMLDSGIPADGRSARCRGNPRMHKVDLAIPLVGAWLSHGI
jgi:hypothetical protein